MASAHLADHLLNVERRRAERDRVYVCTRLRLRDRSVDCEIVNISRFGFMIRCEALLADREPVRVRLPLVDEIAAHAAWALGGRIGFELVSAIDERVYPALLASLPRG